ncbi:DNA-(apurinic or apyrimidinic site) lyase 2-like [Neltuma alba]|uniref:DNA-(apurinic or apyrimidinic site) lyase 2-like n=1 Tax=Neltuma alba TaxID=207710 RepID=UPI0010A452C4|nr:DNA-(apurinic or apyrimidinic site) lyase 2-like [Prosopis alba]
MKIVTYNVNGLRQRIAQFGSLRNLLNSFDADIICLQETKLRRQEVTADLVMADGYESFFSCTRSSDKGRTGYSGVATFCRVKSAFSSDEVALPLAAEEGFTGLIGNSPTGKSELPFFLEGLLGFSNEELLGVDSEGRCIITDHGHFVLFNLYGPRAESDDTERVQFKRNFFTLLQKRWESLLDQGRKIFVVGDLNIAPQAIDRCEAGPDFENDEFRRWFRSLLLENGGQFFDVFRAKHPDRKEAYTCWPQNTGAEVFNFGTRIDHILCAGSCLHEADDLEGHNFIRCHVKECDILTQYKRCKPGSNLSAQRWKEGRSVKLEGSDHAPVYVTLHEIPNLSLHSTPPLSSRYVPVVRGLQQTLVSVLTKRRVSEQMKSCKMSGLLSDEDIVTGSTCERVKESFDNSGLSVMHTGDCDVVSSQDSETNLESNEQSGSSSLEAVGNYSVSSGSEHGKVVPVKSNRSKKKARSSQCSQLSLMSFFKKSTNVDNMVKDSCTDIQAESSQLDHHSNEASTVVDQSGSSEQYELCAGVCKDASKFTDDTKRKESSNVALLEWQRIQQLMQNSIPLCKGHKEPCIARVVKKQGPNFGRRFYVCARAEGPASNPEANCGYFKWATSKSRN